MKREVRIQQRLLYRNGREDVTEPRPLVIVDSKAWVVVRRADHRNAAPFVISRKEWDALPIQSHPVAAGDMTNATPGERLRAAQRGLTRDMVTASPTLKLI